MLTCHSGKSTGVINNFNNGSIVQVYHFQGHYILLAHGHVLVGHLNEPLVMSFVIICAFFFFVVTISAVKRPIYGFI